MKTISLKKVSAVAVASLGFGLLSVVPVSAATGTATITSINLKTVTASPTVGTAVAVNMGVVIPAQTFTAADDVQFQAQLTTVPTAGATGITASVTAMTTATLPVNFANTAAVVAGGACTLKRNADITTVASNTAGSVTSSTTVGSCQFSFTPQKAGTYVMTVWHDTTTAPNGLINGGEVSTSVSITVAASAVYSNTLSTAYQSFGAGSTAPTAALTAAPISQTAAKGGLDATNDIASSIDVVVKGSTGSDYAAASLSAEISGPGYLVWADEAATVADKCLVSPTYGANVGRSLAARAVDAQSRIAVCADGTSGVATITIKITDADDAVYTLATRTVTFFGAVTKIVATGVLTNARAAGASATGTAVADRDLSSETPSVIVFATDKNGVGVTGLTVTAKSSDVTVMNTALPTVAEDIKNTTNIYSSGGAGYYNIQTQSASSAASGGKATMTFRVVDPAGDGTTYLTSDVAFTIGGSVATEVITTDKTSYAPGEAMVLTITAKDSAGNPVYDGAATPSAVTSSKAAVGLPSAAASYVAGKKSWGSTGGVYAPALAGAFVLSATGTDAAATTRTATATVTDANAGLLTQIDALNAKIVALNALIAKIMKKLGVK